MDDLLFYVLFNSISVILGRCSDDNERLCAMCSFRSKVFRVRVDPGLKGPLHPGKPTGNNITCSAFDLVGWLFWT